MRIREFQKSLEAECALIENPVDLLYLTGIQMSKGILAVTKGEVMLFVDGRYFAKAERENVCPVRLLVDNAVKEWLESQGIQTVEIDGAITTVDRFEALIKEVPHLKTRSGLLRNLRALKESKEISALKKAAELTMRGFKHVESLLQEGVTEEELALEFEFFVRKNGASGLSFEPIIAFGENSAYPHYRAGKTRLQQNQIVLIDVGAVVDRYAGDLTRVVFFGKSDPELEKMLFLTKIAQQKAFEAVRPGVTCGELDRIVRAVFAKAGVEDLFNHSLGHGIGLETHEFPTLRATGPHCDIAIEENMVFTLEPGLYRPGLGGVRWEDVVVVTKHGCERC